jgi:hypothetical protein
MMRTLSLLGEITFPVTLTLEDLERVLTWPTWDYFRELVESTGSQEAGLVATAAVFSQIEAHRADLTEDSYNEYGRKLLLYILELMDQQGQWQDYLQAWDQFRREYTFYIDYSTRSLDHHGIRMQPFVLGASADGLRVHFLWLTLNRKEAIELMVQEAWAIGKPRGPLLWSKSDLTLAEIEKRMEWIWRRTVVWSGGSDPCGAGEGPR